VGLESLNVNTNGMLLTNDVADRLLDSGLTLIVIGIDGFSKTAYEQIRVLGDRDVVYANVEHLLARRAERAAGPEIMVQYIEMDENEGEIEAFRNYWLERGATVKYRNKLSWGGRFETPLEFTRDERIPCPWAVTMMHLFWDGRVPRCPGDTEGDEGVGNAWDASLSELWAKLGTYRDLHLTRQFDKLPDRCQDCKDWMTGGAVKLRPSRPVRASA
jgi:MoaA/NifB/PqqE/SkfB family radical SAM enzyme